MLRAYQFSSEHFNASGFGSIFDTSAKAIPLRYIFHSLSLISPVYFYIEDAIKNAYIFL